MKKLSAYHGYGLHIHSHLPDKCAWALTTSRHSAEWGPYPYGAHSDFATCLLSGSLKVRLFLECFSEIKRQRDHLGFNLSSSHCLFLTTQWAVREEGTREVTSRADDTSTGHRLALPEAMKPQLSCVVGGWGQVICGHWRGFHIFTRPRALSGI